MKRRVFIRQVVVRRGDLDQRDLIDRVPQVYAKNQYQYCICSGIDFSCSGTYSGTCSGHPLMLAFFRADRVFAK